MRGLLVDSGSMSHPARRTSMPSSPRIVTWSLVGLVVGFAVPLVLLYFLRPPGEHLNYDRWLYIASGAAALTLVVTGALVAARRNAVDQVDEAQARQRVRQAENHLADALRGTASATDGSAPSFNFNEREVKNILDRWALDQGPAGHPSPDDQVRDDDQIRDDDQVRDDDQIIDDHQVRDDDQIIDDDWIIDDQIIDDQIPIQPRDDALTLAALWDLTHKRLDLYHQIVTRQARRSFGAAQAAIIIGFILLVVLAVLAAQAKTTSAAISAGGSGAVGAAFSAYIGRTFIRSQESAADHLRTYFDQPLELSRYLAAERLLANAADLSAQQRADILGTLVQAIATAGYENDAKPERKNRKGKRANA